MQKKVRQYIALLFAVAAYYVLHEGAHLLCAVRMGVFEQVRFMGVGVQVQIAAQQLTQLQLGVFCLVGPVAALLGAWLLAAFANRICSCRSKLFRACMYYTTAALLFIDPLYLSVLSGFFGGGDMNGISLLVPSAVAKALFGVLLVLHAALFARCILPKYKVSFCER
ncbi:MAG: hypothetical protein IJC61_06590 [Oscillospiraceae bacterium]|nr:hypothetical protein [Oscillospiraceae bacterium]